MVNNKIKNITDEAIKSLNEISERSSVIGKPITIDDKTTVIPITKITMGFRSGGGEYGQIKSIKKGKDYPTSAGSGAVVSIKPSGFLIVSESGAKIVKTDNDIYDKIFEKTQQIIGRINEENSDTI